MHTRVDAPTTNHHIPGGRMHAHVHVTLASMFARQSLTPPERERALRDLRDSVKEECIIAAVERGHRWEYGGPPAEPVTVSISVGEDGPTIATVTDDTGATHPLIEAWVVADVCDSVRVTWPYDAWDVTDETDETMEDA